MRPALVPAGYAFSVRSYPIGQLLDGLPAVRETASTLAYFAV